MTRLYRLFRIFSDGGSTDGECNKPIEVLIHFIPKPNYVEEYQRYGTTIEKEKQRLLHHAKISAIRKAWHREKDTYKSGFTGSFDWSAAEIEELLKNGYVANYEGQYVHDVQEYPELAEDPYNIKFVKKQTESTKKRRRKRDSNQQSCPNSWWLTWSEC
ncbi:teneurin-a-like [Sitophilus oryzae]|uniref:Teneurin-a-like n=1 Tax=Sitophilus oryzae TaxID=7048 RepID=A0A6J2X8A8_SITOR|nr:teneurin-a-like [Sitophilus oryzae]